MPKRPVGSRLRCGIIGCGVIAPTHVESLRQQEDVAVTWACDLVAEKSRGLAEKYGIPHVTRDYREVIAAEDIDCVHVCTDHASHVPITVAALKGRKHVLCEKALAASREGLDLMLATHAQCPGVVFSGVFQHRFDTIHQYLKELVEGGIFGTILTAGVQVRCFRSNEYYQADTWRGTWAEEGGAVLINQAIHFIDVLVWLMGGVAAVAGSFSNLTHKGAIETEDTAVAALRFKNGALGTLEATSSSNLDWEPTISIHGAAGSVELRHGQGLKVAFRDRSVRDAGVQERVERELQQKSRERTIVQAGKSYYGPSHQTQIADFIAAVREKRLPFVTAVSAGHTVDVVLAVYQSARENRWLELRENSELKN